VLTDLGWFINLGEENAEMLKTISKQDVMDLFMSRIHPSSPERAKLAVHMYSQKQQQKRISTDAAEAFQSAVLDAAVNLPGDAGKENVQVSVADQMTLDEYAEQWKSILGDGPHTKELLNMLPTLADKYPAHGEEDMSTRREGAVYIEDIELFKRGLERSEEPKGVEWGDVPVN
jgi:insulysin